jgi:hypothetical protein
VYDIGLSKVSAYDKISTLSSSGRSDQPWKVVAGVSLVKAARSLGRLIWLFSHGDSRIVYLHVSAHQLRGFGKRVAMGWTYTVALRVVTAIVADSSANTDVLRCSVEVVERAGSEVRCCCKRQGTLVALVGTVNEDLAKVSDQLIFHSNRAREVAP